MGTAINGSALDEKPLSKAAWVALLGYVLLGVICVRGCVYEPVHPVPRAMDRSGK